MYTTVFSSFFDIYFSCFSNHFLLCTLVVAYLSFKMAGIAVDITRCLMQIEEEVEDRGRQTKENKRWIKWAECSYITPVHFLSLSLWRSTRAKSGWAKPLLPYIQPKQQITDCPSNPMHQGMCHCHHAPTTQSPCSHRHHACCSAGYANPPSHLP